MFRLLVSNRDMLDSLKPYLPDEYLAKVPVAYTGVDKAEIQQIHDAQFDRRQILEKFGLPLDRFLVFSLGQLIERKGCMVLLDSVEQLRRIEPSLFFVWIGDGQQRRAVEKRVADKGLDKTFMILPPRRIGEERLDLLRVLAAADLFVHPSFLEGLPGVVLEAMALGKACVASQVNAIPEAITDGEDGILVPPGDPKALADAVLRLFKDPEFRERLGAAGRIRVLGTFDEAIAARKTVDYYNSCREAGAPG
jgi:glycosyltransferase involved in cell wall biosynthesis